MTRLNLEDVRLAVKRAGINANIENFGEKNINKFGKAVTSLIETDKGITLFSKCYDSSLYPDVKGYEPLEKQLSDELQVENLFDYERKVLTTLNSIDVEIAPILFHVVENQERLIMEYVEEHSLQWKFTEIDKKVYQLESEIKGLSLRNISSQKITDKKQEIQNLKKQKEYWIRKGVDNLSKFRKLTNDNLESFRRMGIKEMTRNEDREIFEDYLSRILLFSNPYLKNKGEVIKFLESKEINLSGYSSRFAEYFSKEIRQGKKISVIHGDMGPHHIRLNGKIIDFDEVRLGSHYYDIVRLLKNPFVNQEERKTPSYLAQYMIRELINEGSVKEEEIEKLTVEEIVERVGKEKFASSLKRFYDINLKEDIHIASVLRKYSPKAIRYFTGNHPIYNSKSSLINWRLEEINNVLQILLSKDGREFLLKDDYSLGLIESIRSFFETTGLTQTGSEDVFSLFNYNNSSNGDKKLLNGNRSHA